MLDQYDQRSPSGASGSSHYASPSSFRASPANSSQFVFPKRRTSKPPSSPSSDSAALQMEQAPANGSTGQQIEAGERLPSSFANIATPENPRFSRLKATASPSSPSVRQSASIMTPETGILRALATPGTGSSVRFGKRMYDDGDESIISVRSQSRSQSSPVLQPVPLQYISIVGNSRDLPPFTRPLPSTPSFTTTRAYDVADISATNASTSSPANSSSEIMSSTSPTVRIPTPIAVVAVEPAGEVKDRIGSINAADVSSLLDASFTGMSDTEDVMDVRVPGTSGESNISEPSTESAEKPYHVSADVTPDESAVFRNDHIDMEAIRSGFAMSARTSMDALSAHSSAHSALRPDGLPERPHDDDRPNFLVSSERSPPHAPLSSSERSTSYTALKSEDASATLGPQGKSFPRSEDHDVIDHVSFSRHSEAVPSANQTPDRTQGNTTFATDRGNISSVSSRNQWSTPEWSAPRSQRGVSRSPHTPESSYGRDHVVSSSPTHYLDRRSPHTDNEDPVRSLPSRQDLSTELVTPFSPEQRCALNTPVGMHEPHKAQEMPTLPAGATASVQSVAATYLPTIPDPQHAARAANDSRDISGPDASVRGTGKMMREDEELSSSIAASKPTVIQASDSYSPSRFSTALMLAQTQPTSLPTDGAAEQNNAVDLFAAVDEIQAIQDEQNAALVARHVRSERECQRLQKAALAEFQQRKQAQKTAREAQSAVNALQDQLRECQQEKDETLATCEKRLAEARIFAERLQSQILFKQAFDQERDPHDAGKQDVMAGSEESAQLPSNAATEESIRRLREEYERDAEVRQDAAQIAHEKQINTLQEELAAIRRERDELLVDADVLQSESHSSVPRTEHEEVVSELDTLRLEVIHLRTISPIDSQKEALLVAELAEARLMLNDAVSARQQAEEQMEAIQSEAASAAASQRESSVAEARDFRKQLNDLRMELEAQWKQADVWADECQALKSVRDQLEQTLKETAARLQETAAADQLSELEEKVRKLQEELSTANRKQASYLQQSEQLRLDKEAVETLLMQADEQRKEDLRAVGRETSRCTELQREKQSLQQDLAQLGDHNASIERDFLAAQEMHAADRAALDEATFEARKVREVEKRIAFLEQHPVPIEVEREHKETVDKLTARVAELEREMGDRGMTIAKLLKAKDRLESENLDYGIALSVKQQELSLLKRRREASSTPVSGVGLIRSESQESSNVETIELQKGPHVPKEMRRRITMDPTSGPVKRGTAATPAPTTARALPSAAATTNTSARPIAGRRTSAMGVGSMGPPPPRTASAATADQTRTAARRASNAGSASDKEGPTSEMPPFVRRQSATSSALSRRSSVSSQASAASSNVSTRSRIVTKPRVSLAPIRPPLQRTTSSPSRPARNESTSLLTSISTDGLGLSESRAGLNTVPQDPPMDLSELTLSTSTQRQSLTSSAAQHSSFASVRRATVASRTDKENIPNRASRVTGSERSTADKLAKAPSVPTGDFDQDMAAVRTSSSATTRARRPTMLPA